MYKARVLIACIVVTLLIGTGLTATHFVRSPSRAQLHSNLWFSPSLRLAPPSTSPAGKRVYVPPKDKKPSEHPVFYRNKVMVLMFHNVSVNYRSKGTITPKVFETVVRKLLTDGYHIIPANQLVRYLEGKSHIPPNAVVITFDDGYAGMYDHVYPVLKRYRVPATFFIITGNIGINPNFLTWNQVRKMSASGLATFGGHTHQAHYGVPTSLITTAPATVARIYNSKTGKQETESAYQARILADSRKAQEEFKRELGRPSPLFAYPYGAYTPELEKVLRTVGYRYFFTTLSGPNQRGQEPHHIYRINVGVAGLSASDMVRLIRESSRIDTLKTQRPPSWLPRWAEDRSLQVLYVLSEAPNCINQ